MITSGRVDLILFSTFSLCERLGCENPTQSKTKRPGLNVTFRKLANLQQKRDHETQVGKGPRTSCTFWEVSPGGCNNDKKGLVAV